MADYNPWKKLFLAIMARIESAVPEIRHIDQDLGQLEGNSSRPEVGFPCVLVDFDQWALTNIGKLEQLAEGDVVIKLAHAQYTPTGNAIDPVYRDEALKYYEHEWNLNKALHGWSPGDEFGVLTRTGITTQNRAPGIRVRTIRYRLEFEDRSTTRPITKVPKPPFERTEPAP